MVGSHDSLPGKDTAQVTILSVAARLAPFLITAWVALGWLDLLRPPPRRQIVTDRPWAAAHLLLSAWVLLYWGARLTAPPPAVTYVLRIVREVLFAANLIPAAFIFRPSSRDFKSAERLWKQGNLDGTAAACRRVIASGRRDEVPRAAFGLGSALMRQGDLDAASTAFQRAIASGGPRIVPAAVFNLGVLRERQGDDVGARAAYEQIIGIRGAKQAAKAAWRLGYVLERNGDDEGARRAYQLAIDHGPADVREPAARALRELNGTQAEG
jgi:tetratricopeptide (TPR) repeat protein